jgi:hypothetical protein
MISLAEDPPAEDPPAERSRVVTSPYEGWETWAENLDKPPCKTNDDCGLDRTGRETYCKKWKGASEHDRGHCRPRWLNRRRQLIQYRNLRRIVEHVCRPPSWWTPEAKCWNFKWRTARECKKKRWCDPDKLTRFLSVPIKRESTWDHQTDHHLDPDRLANRSSYKRMYRRGVYEDNPYFHEGLTLGKNGKPLFRLKDLRFRCDRDNPHDRNCDGIPDRWAVGYGWYGMNAALFTWRWDPKAPPEVLARRVPATLTILRAMRQAWRKLEGGVDCRDAQGRLYQADLMLAGKQERDYKRDTRPEQTWWTLHRAVFGGDICPIELKGHRWYRRGFARRMSNGKVGLDPDEHVTLEMLGESVPFERQWEVVASIEAQFESVWETEETEREENRKPIKIAGGATEGEDSVVLAEP